MITADEAIEIARARAADNGWGGLGEPVITLRKFWSGKPKNYKVETTPRLRGTRSHFTIDAETGAIVAEGYIPR